MNIFPRSCIVCGFMALVWFAGTVLLAEPATRPATGPAGDQAGRAPAAFYFSYAFDKAHPRRDWTRLDATTWEEDDGVRLVRYELVEVSADAKDPGVILVRLPHRDMQVFVPTLDNPDKRLGWRYPPGKEPKNAPPMGEGSKWYTLGEMGEGE